MAQKLECNWCGKESIVWWNGDLLCENCWEGVKIDVERKNFFSKPLKISLKDYLKGGVW